MAHELMQHDTMVSGNGIVPWHGLGQVVNGLMTSEEVLKLANLNWNVSVRPLSFSGNDGNLIEVPGTFATVRDDIEYPLGVVKSRYTPLQNKDAFSFFDTLISEKEAFYETGGSLQNGSKVWILARLPKDIVVLNQDRTETYALIYTSHDGTARCKIKLVNTRVVCANTVAMALSEKGREIAISHTPNIVEKVRQAHETLGLVNKMQLELQEAYENFAKKEINQGQTLKYLNDCFQLNVEDQNDFEKLTELQQLVEIGRGTDLKGVRGSLWGAFNAVTEYTSHNVNYRSEENKMNSQVFGSSASINQRAFDLAVQLVK